MSVFGRQGGHEQRAASYPSEDRTITLSIIRRSAGIAYQVQVLWTMANLLVGQIANREIRQPRGHSLLRFYPTAVLVRIKEN